MTQYTFDVLDGEITPIGEASVLPSGALVINIPPTHAGRMLASRLVMGDTNKIVLKDVKL